MSKRKYAGIEDKSAVLAKIGENSAKRKKENAAKEAEWAKKRAQREAEKQTEAYKRQQAANERHKKNIQLEVQQGTAKANAAAQVKAKGREASVKAREKREAKKIPSLEKEVVKRHTPTNTLGGTNKNYSNYGYAYKTRELTDEGKVQKWLDPSYKMSDKEKQEARDWLKTEQKRSTAEIRKGNQDFMKPGTYEYNRTQQSNQLRAKVNNAGTRGFLLPFLKATNALVKGTEAVTGTQDSQVAKALNKQLDEAFLQDELSAGQSPIRHGIGNLAGMGSMYAATNPAFDAAAEGLGVTSTAGKVIANQIGQNAQDLALDTFPEYQRLKDKGLSEAEIRKEIGKNVAYNAAGNAAMQGLSDFVIPTIAKKLGLKEDIPQLAQKFNGKSTVIGSAPDVKIPDIQAQKLDAVRQGDAVKLHDLNMQEDAAEKALKQAQAELKEAPKVETPKQPAQKVLSDTDISAIKDETRKLKQSFRGKARYVKDQDNEYAKAFIKTLDELADNPNAETYTAARQALNDYIDNSSTRNMQTWNGVWYKKVFDNYNPETKTSPFIDSLEQFAEKYGLKDVESVGTPKALKVEPPKTEAPKTEAEKYAAKRERQLKQAEKQAENGNVKGSIETIRKLNKEEGEMYEKHPEWFNEAGELKTPKTEAPKGHDKSLEEINNIRGMVSLYKGKELPKTAQKNMDYLEGSLDRLEEAVKSGDTPTFREAYEDYRKAYNRVKDNLSKAGDKSFYSQREILNEEHPRNIKNLFSKEQLEQGFENLGNEDIDLDDLPFNETMYDKYGRITYSPEKAVRIEADTDGLRPREGVDVNAEEFNYTPTEIPKVETSGNIPEDDIDIILREPTYNGDTLTAKQKISKVRTNSLERAGLDTEEELKTEIPRDMFAYMEEKEQMSYQAAQNMVNNDWNRTVDKYTADYDPDDIANLRNAQDIDAMMLTHKKLNEQARAATDPVEKRYLYDLTRKVTLNLRKAGTKAGQAIQAFAKWTRTPEGAITSAQGFAEDMVENGLKHNPKMANEVKDVSKEIENFLDEMDIDAMSREEIERMIENAIIRRDHLRNRITKGDISKIAESIMNDKQYADIQKQLEFLSTGYADIDAETIETVQDIFERAQDLPFNSKERVDLENEAYKLLASKIVPNGGSFRDKLDAWRYLAMLANPTTHIKNMVGNLLFGQGMASTKNTLAAMIEEAADRVSKAAGGNGIERTKSILTNADKPLVDAAGKDAYTNAYRELSGNKYYDTGSAIDNAIPAFNTQTKAGRALNKVSELNTNLLNKEDEAAVIAKYRTSLAGFLKANGADASIFNATDKASMDLLESGRQYAINQAKEAAFHQDSEIANLMSQFSRNARNSEHLAGKALGLTADVVVPFKKTPINILKSAIEYSPAQFAKVATEIPKLNSGVVKPAQFIDDISKGVTGTAALGIGALLAHEGIVKIGSSKSDEESSFDTQTGRQNVAIKVGNRYVELSELIPAAAPIILGATIYETYKDSKGEENALNTIFSGMSAIANGVTDMTMLSGIADTLSSIRSAKSNNEVLGRLGLDIGGNLASQLLPTVSRKANITLDDTKRSTYSDKTGATKVIDQTAKYLQTKIPFLQQAGELMKESDVPALQAVGNRLALQPNIDVKGQVQESPGVAGFNNILGRTYGNFISPVKITEDTSTAFDNERRRLYNTTGESKVLPYIGSNEANIKDVGQLTPEQWTEYRQTRGQLREDLATNLISSDYYHSIKDADRAEILSAIDSFSKSYSQSKYGKPLSDADQKLAEIYEANGTEGLIDRMVKGQQLASLDVSGTEKMYDLIDKGGTKAVQQYLDIKEKAPKTEKGNVSKPGLMNELAKLPKDQQELMYNAFVTKPSEAEQAAYAKGGASAAIAAYQQNQKQQAQNAAKKEAKKKEVAKAAGVSVDSLDDIQSQLASYGAINSPTTVQYYNSAKQVIPSLTPKGYANYLNTIGGSDYKISQKEMLSYGNNNNLSEEDMKRYWNAFGSWKKNPVLVNGTWKAK